MNTTRLFLISVMLVALLVGCGGEPGPEPAAETAAENPQAETKQEAGPNLIDVPAPDFALNDLDGNSISLADLAGKVVILDFWATWCGPCRASFPAMQEAVEKYKGDKNVVFLFVNTMEYGEDKEKKVADFISSNELPFQVLMDSDNKMSLDYKVSSIPTKMIIDGEGHIRHVSVGFGGSATRLVDELSRLIAAVR